jgi:heme-degrading monooxygenase HmoA
LIGRSEAPTPASHLSQSSQSAVFVGGDTLATSSSAAAFEAARSGLFGLACRMLGFRADAVDIVQETYVRWHQLDRGAVEKRGGAARHGSDTAGDRPVAPAKDGVRGGRRSLASGVDRERWCVARSVFVIEDGGDRDEACEEDIMLKITDINPKVSVRDQLHGTEPGPVVVINTFTVPQEDLDGFLEAWASGAAYFKRQPGFISTQLHRGLAGSGVFLSDALWESLEKFRTAFGNLEAQQTLARFPDGVTAWPHVFRKVAVADICVA